MKKGKTDIKPMVSNLLLIFLLIIFSCSNSTNKKNTPADKKSSSDEPVNKRISGYNFSAPDERITLPPILHEISGIAVLDSLSVACIQDEHGIIFVYDILKKEIRKQIYFFGDGDYEGITNADGTIYVLRSDGVLFETKNLETSHIAKMIPLKNIPYLDNEGLCFDRTNHRLLIAPKERPDSDSDSKKKHRMYTYDLAAGKLIDKPVLNFDLSAIKKYASDNKIFPGENNKKKDPDSKPDIKFRPSAIGIHPVTGQLFVVSGAEQMLFVFSLDGKIANMISLDPEIFNMPEGITFFRNGDMLISNEGQNSNATIIRLNYNPD